jgi:hypothetical protein
MNKGIKITERGWPGHFICAPDCLFRRNTLIEIGTRKVVISTVGNLRDKQGRMTSIGHNRFYETLAFDAKENDPYNDIDVSKDLYNFTSECGIYGEDPRELGCYVDNEANEIHEGVVAEFVRELQVNQEFGR